MSIMALRCSIVFATIVLALPASTSAAQSAPTVCGVSLDQESRSAFSGFDRRYVGTVVFLDPHLTGKKVQADRFYLRARARCAEIADRSGDSDDVPDIVVDVMGESTRRVVAIAFRPRVRDCQTVRDLIGSVLGAPQTFSADSAEWALSDSRRRVLVTESDGSCWIHQQRVLF